MQLQVYCINHRLEIHLFVQVVIILLLPIYMFLYMNSLKVWVFLFHFTQLYIYYTFYNLSCHFFFFHSPSKIQEKEEEKGQYERWQFVNFPTLICCNCSHFILTIQVNLIVFLNHMYFHQHAIKSLPPHTFLISKPFKNIIKKVKNSCCVHGEILAFNVKS